MTIGEQLLVSCLKKKDQKIISLIQKNWLDGAEIKEYRFVMDYFKDSGELIGVKSFCDKFKLDTSEVDSRPSYYLNQVRERYIFSMMADNIPKILKGAKDDPREKLRNLQSLVATLAVDSVESKDILYSEDTDKRIKDYEERSKSSGVTYLSMGSFDMDEMFYGYRKQDLITIGGKAGQGKSWLLVFLTYLLEKVIRKKESETGMILGDILFITNEMGEEEIMERLDCIKYRLPYADFLQGHLEKDAEKRYYDGLKTLRKTKSRIRIVYSCQTIDELSTYIGLYQPSAVFIDGSYLMEPKMDEGWEKIVYVTRNLKRLAKNFRTPIINTTQLKRGTGKSASHGLEGQDDFAYSGSYTQDSDIAIRMFQDADMKFHDLVGCEVVKGRRVISGSKILFQNDLNKMIQSLTKPADDTPTEPEIKDKF